MKKLYKRFLKNKKRLKQKIKLSKQKNNSFKSRKKLFSMENSKNKV